MSNVVAFLLLIFIILLIIGFFAPKVSLFWFQKEKTKKNSATFYGTAILIFIILLGLTPKNKNDKNNTANSEKQSENSSDKSLAPSVEAFKEAFNKFCVAANSNINISKFDFRSGKKNIASCDLAKKMHMIIGLDKTKNNRVIDLLLLAQPDDNNPNWAEDMLITMGGMISVGNPEMTNGEIGDFLKELGMDSKDLKDGFHNTVKKHGFTYDVAVSNTIGVSLTIY